MKSVKRIMFLLLAISILITIPISANASTPNNTSTTKPTTSQTTHCTNKDNHSISCGKMGKWFDNRTKLVQYYNDVVSEWNKKVDNGEITEIEYYAKCPTGYECWSCSYCKKWTGNFKYRETTELSTSHTHIWDSGTITTPATCTEKGVITYHCTECDETLMGSIPATGHNYNKTVIAPTCVDKGYTKFVCSNCGDAYVSDYVNALGHSYKYVPNNDGTHKKVCSNCDFVEIENCSKVKDGDYEICTICKAKYEIAKPTDPSKPTQPTEPSSKPDTKPSTEPTSPIEPSTEEKPSTSSKDDEKVTKPSTEPTTQADKETTTSVATTEKTTSNTKSPATGNNLEPFGIALTVSCVVGCVVLMLVMYKTKCKKETE